MAEKVVAQIGDQSIVIESGKLAKQADGSVTVQLGETVVLVAAVAATKAKPGQEFFPLTVDYRERAAAAGRFPGGYFKREGRPSEKEILTSRIIDRPIRPLFPKGWFNEVQVQVILLSADGQNDADVLAANGASAALLVSDIPWAGPIGAVRVGRVGGQFVANPTHDQIEQSDVDIFYVGNENQTVMFEGSADELPDADFVAALRFGQEAIQPLIAAQKELAAKLGKTKRAITTNVVPDDILKAAKDFIGSRVIDALLIPGKLAREAACKAIETEMGDKLKALFSAEKVNDFVVKDTFYYIQKEAIRSLILDGGKRLDGRGFADLRPLGGEVGILPRTHGSSVFSRGETQALASVTLGTSEDIQEFDAYTGGPTEKKFLLHYSFPHFSVGETGRISGPGRREIGHGALAERSVEPMLPLKEYPYTVRVTSEILESNGSSSMATICATTLALMDAGVPIERPVAGISIGICTEYADGGQLARYKLLTDIIGWEDHFCDMDCKIAGTAKGITGFQLDLKLTGLPIEVLAEAIEAARLSRLQILDFMAGILPAPRTEMSKYAPRIIRLKINPEKIGAVIGPGGKNIKALVEKSGCEINIEDDGTVMIFSIDEEGMRIAREGIEAVAAEIEVGKVYRGKVVSIKEFGAFVEVLPGQDGLVHISELADFRVKATEDVVKMGDVIWVKCIGVDEKGRVRLSRKAAMAERAKELEPRTAGEGEEAPVEPREPRSEGSEGRELRDREPREGRERPERPEFREPRPPRGPREPRAPREPRGEPRDPRPLEPRGEPRPPEAREPRGDFREREPRTDAPREYREPRPDAPREYREPRDPRPPRV